MGKCVTIIEYSKYKGIPVRTLRSFMASRKIPFYRCGHRTLFLDVEEVDKALKKFEVRAIGDAESR